MGQGLFYIVSQAKSKPILITAFVSTFSYRYLTTHSAPNLANQHTKHLKEGAAQSFLGRADMINRKLEHVSFPGVSGRYFHLFLERVNVVLLRSLSFGVDILWVSLDFQSSMIVLLCCGI